MINHITFKRKVHLHLNARLEDFEDVQSLIVLVQRLYENHAAFIILNESLAMQLKALDRLILFISFLSFLIASSNIPLE
jgi:hypothetical protein